MKLATSAILATLALGACGVDENVANDTNVLPVDQAAIGAGTLVLTVDGGIVVGEEVTFEVAGAQPGELVYFLVGPAEVPAFTCPPIIDPECLDIQNPFYINYGVANGLGVASLTVTVPSIPDGFTGFFQAVTGSPTAATSNVVQKIKRNDVPSAFHLEGFWIGDIVADPAGNTWDGVFFRDFVRDADDAILCSAVSTMSATDFAGATPCADCEFAFDATVGTEFELDTEIPGDCNDFIGVNENFFSWFDGGMTQSWGLDADYYIPGGGGATAPYMLYYDAAGATWIPLGQTYYNTGFWGFGLIYGGTFYY